jgi:hypothetical protein
MRDGDPTFMTFDFKNKTIANITREFVEIHIDKSKMRSVGFNALKDLLLKLNVYKATGDY